MTTPVGDDTAATGTVLAASPLQRLRGVAARPVDVAWPIAVVLALATVDWAWTLRLGARSIALPAPQLGVLLVALGAGVLVVGRGRLRWDWLVAGYVLLAAVPQVQSRALGVDAAGGTGIFVTVGLLLVALLQYDVGDRSRTRTVTMVFAVFGVVLAVWMGVQWVAAVDDPGQFYDLKRSVSLPIGPGNFVAAVLLVPILLVLGVSRTVRWRLPVLVVLAGGFLVTLSRAGWLVLAVVLGLRWWLRRDEERPRPSTGQWAVLVAVLVALLSAYLLTGSSPGERLDTLVSPAFGPRLTIWEAAWNGFLDDPVAGFGLNGFAELSAQAGRFETHPHSMLLTGFGMLGLVGGVLYLGVWVVALRRTLRGPAAMTVGLATLAIALHAQVGAWSLYLVFELVLVMLVVVGTHREGPTRARGVTEVALPWGRPEDGHE